MDEAVNSSTGLRPRCLCPSLKGKRMCENAKRTESVHVTTLKKKKKNIDDEAEESFPSHPEGLRRCFQSSVEFKEIMQMRGYCYCCCWLLLRANSSMLSLE